TMHWKDQFSLLAVRFSGCVTALNFSSTLKSANNMHWKLNLQKVYMLYLPLPDSAPRIGIPKHEGLYSDSAAVQRRRILAVPHLKLSPIRQKMCSMQCSWMPILKSTDFELTAAHQPMIFLCSFSRIY